MEAIIFTGIQATGKSTFYKARFFRTHVRINLDMLRTRHRERLLLEACLEMKQPFVVDNTNPAREDRKRYIKKAKAGNFRVIGYCFHSDISQCLARNSNRPDNERVPEKGIKGTYSRLKPPDYSEGFDELYDVRISPHNGFEVHAREREE